MKLDSSQVERVPKVEVTPIYPANRLPMSTGLVWREFQGTLSLFSCLRSREPGLTFSLCTNWPHLGRCPNSTLTCPGSRGSLQKWSLMTQVLLLSNNDLLRVTYGQSAWLSHMGDERGN